jgi:hypothetical protein
MFFHDLFGSSDPYLGIGIYFPLKEDYIIFFQEKKKGKYGGNLTHQLVPKKKEL